MKFEEILKTYGKIEREAAELKLYVLGNTLFGSNKWKFTPGYNSETSTSDSGKQHYVTIAESALMDGCNDSEYNKAGYVLTVRHMYHESRPVHVECCMRGRFLIPWVSGEHFMFFQKYLLSDFEFHISYAPFLVLPVSCSFFHYKTVFFF